MFLPEPTISLLVSQNQTILKRCSGGECPIKLHETGGKEERIKTGGELQLYGEVLRLMALSKKFQKNTTKEVESLFLGKKKGRKNEKKSTRYKAKSWGMKHNLK